MQITFRATGRSRPRRFMGRPISSAGRTLRVRPATSWQEGRSSRQNRRLNCPRVSKGALLRVLIARDPCAPLARMRARASLRPRYLLPTTEIISHIGKKMPRARTNTMPPTAMIRIGSMAAVSPFKA